MIDVVVDVDLLLLICMLFIFYCFPAGIGELVCLDWDFSDFRRQ